MSAPRLIPVTPEDLPEYPIGREETLAGNSFVKWQHQRWMSSSLFRLGTWECQGMARALFDFAQAETPVGTLPHDDQELAFLLRCPIGRVQELRAQRFGPLHGWYPCRSGTEVRLMHDVVLEQVRDALDRRETRALSNDKKAVAMRLNRLRDALAREGMARDVLRDDVLIERMDQWLNEMGKRRRVGSDYRAALLHAAQMKWFGGLATLD